MNALQRAINAISRNEALDKAGDRIAATLDKALDRLPERQRVEDVLHGKWLGHPVHPPLTSIPIGAWVFAAVLDAGGTVSGKRTPTAGVAIAFGMLAALPTALTGAADWRQTDGEARRIGVAHAMLNSTGLGLFALSILMRRNHLARARLLSFSGLGVIGLSGYLGGHLVSNLRIGVKHEAEPGGSPAYFSESDVDADLAEDMPARIEVEGTPMVVVKHGGRLYGLADVCPHLGCSLSEGSISGDAIVCPCHGSMFSLDDGRVLKGPSAFDVASYKQLLPGPETTPGPVLDLGTE